MYYLKLSLEDLKKNQLGISELLPRLSCKQVGSHGAHMTLGTVHVGLRLVPRPYRVNNTVCTPVCALGLGGQKGRPMPGGGPRAYPWGRAPASFGDPTPPQGSTASCALELLPWPQCVFSCTFVSSGFFLFLRSWVREVSG